MVIIAIVGSASIATSVLTQSTTNEPQTRQTSTDDLQTTACSSAKAMLTNYENTEYANSPEYKNLKDQYNINCP